MLRGPLLNNVYRWYGSSNGCCMENTTNKPILVVDHHPAYNAAHMIVETLDTLFRHTHPAIEISVVDDGSAGRHRRVVRNYGRAFSCCNSPTAAAVRVRATPACGRHRRAGHVFDAD